MKVLFLDIDGVLNSAKWFVENHEKIKTSSSMLNRHMSEIDPAAVARLKTIVDTTGAKVVISSSWRIIHSLVEIKEAISENGWPEFAPIGKTPRLHNGIRGDEIKEWLDKPLYSARHGVVESYVILDDDSDFHFDQPLVQTGWGEGIQDIHVQEAIKILTTNTSQPSCK